MENNTKISKSFIVFLITAVVIWFLITLSKVYTISISFPVKYSDLSQDKILQNEPLKEIDILVKSTGFNILSTRFLNQSIELNAGNLNKKSTFSYYFLINNLNANGIQKSKIKKTRFKGNFDLELKFKKLVWIRFI